MKILFLTRRFYPDIGGVEKHVLLLSKELQKKGHTITVISENTSQNTIDKKLMIFENDGIKIIKINPGINNWFKKFRIWREMWILRNEMKTSDIIHCHDVFFWYLPFRFLYPTKLVYTTFHGYEGYPIKRGAILSRKLSDYLSMGNICIGDFMKKWYGTKPTFVSYGAVDMRSRKQEAEIPGKKESAVFIGRLDDQTGILIYTKAVEMLKKDFPKFQLTVIGDGEYRNKINNKFIILGFKENADRYLPNFQYAFVSRYLAILEAFAAKRLVFAVYDNPVKEDYLKMAPYANNIVIAKTPHELLSQIKYYINHPKEEKEKIDNAYRWVKGQTWEAMANLYLKLWRINE